MKYFITLCSLIFFAFSNEAQIKPISPSIKSKVAKANNAAGLIRYRITINGFTVNNPTADHILEVDGKGDEIFLLGFAQKFNTATGQKIEEKKTRRSLVMGDVNNEYWRQGERIKAGNKPGEQGGLQRGDRFPTNEPWRQYNKPNHTTLPFIISEGMMQKGETVVAIPSIWEYDGTTEFEQGLNAFLSDATKVTIIGGSTVGAFIFGGPVAATAVFSIAMVADMNENGYRTVIDEANNNPIFAKIKNPNSDFNIYVSKTLFGDAKDRPIGMEDAGGGFTYSPLAMKLDYDNMLRYSNRDFGFGKGVLPLKFIEAPQLQGNYTLYLQIETTTDAGLLKMDNLFNTAEAATLNPVYTIKSAYDNRSLLTGAEGKVVLGNVGQDNGNWRFTKVPNTSDQFYIEDMYSYSSSTPIGALDVLAHSMENGGEVIWYKAIRATNQRWKIIPYGDGTFSIIANESRKALSFDFKTNKLIQYENRYNPDQRWKIE